MVGGAVKYFKVSGFSWESESKMEFNTLRGERIVIDGDAVSVVSADGSATPVDPSAVDGRRRLQNAWGGALMTSGAFTALHQNHEVVCFTMMMAATSNFG